MDKGSKRRKLVTALCVTGVVIVGAGAGLWVWHEQPGFCGSVCHDTMGSYVESYEGGEMLASQHAQADVVCLDCHEAELHTQLAELQVQLSGEYRLPLAKMETDDAFCLRDGCHTREKIVTATADYAAGGGTKVNPHEITFSADYGDTESPHQVGGETAPCATCHTMHRTSAGIDYCYDACHHTQTFDSCYGCHDHR
ncbi:cytochrome c3 family protein [Arabiibacter massiliensis]|uniref:cytochrome c3 family protein n=1 Tax=Arabiibacter massiliensis TaxID=1870985 RepID=UPI0009BC12FF|nr:cytochrome c3 family protein [Arabiibacter massiliensis]